MYSYRQSGRSALAQPTGRGPLSGQQTSRRHLAKNIKLGDYPASLFDLAVAQVMDGGVEFTIGATGPRRECAPWQQEFEAWAKRYQFDHRSNLDYETKGIRRREVSVTIDTKTLLEIILLDIALYHDMTVPMMRNDEREAAARRERKAKLHPGDVYRKPPKAAN